MNPRKAIRVAGITAATYLVIVIAFEVFVVIVGKHEAQAGAQPGGDYLVLTTIAGEKRYDTVVAGVESDGQLYVAANHWPRGWYRRVLANPEVEVTLGGARTAYRAERVAGKERARVEHDYHLPLLIRLLSGFPPRSFLHLIPQADSPLNHAG